jgi:hypothetical protein
MIQELDKLLRSNGYQFVDLGNYEHPDIIPFTFEICYYDEQKYAVQLRNIDMNWTSKPKQFDLALSAFYYIDNLRKLIKVYHELNRSTLPDEIIGDILNTFFELS